MSNSLTRVIQGRKKMQNPYACIDELECVENELVEGAQQSADQLKDTGNPYASLEPTGVRPVQTGEVVTVRHEKVPDAGKMNDPYAFVPGNAEIISRQALSGNPYAADADNEGALQPGLYTNKPMSQLVREFQVRLWKRYHESLPDGVPVNPVDVLDPAAAFEYLGYDFLIHESLDDFSSGENFRIAGLIDQDSKKVHISNQFPSEVQRFTAAHELGHVLLNHQVGLHRDRALDGSPVKGRRDKAEVEADKFATCFLMPEKLVVSRFEKCFGTTSFELTEDTIFALDPGNKADLFNRKRDRRFISRFLAKATQYNNQHFDSLSKHFRVSTEAMAIRLEELGLIKD